MVKAKYKNLFGNPVNVYSRAQALEDGMLIDGTHMAKEAGFKVPVAITHAAWEKHIEWTDEDSRKQPYQDQTGRLWDVLWMLYLACRRSSGEAYLNYRLNVVPRDGRSRKPRQIELKAVMGGGDNGEPVITIMLLDED